MGRGIALNIAKSGLDVLASDLRPELEPEVTGWGARWAESNARVLQEADVMCICLLDDRQVRDFIDTEKAFQTMRSGAVLVVYSTIDPSLMRALQEEAAAHGIEVVGSPVSGSVSGDSLDGTLAVMVGGRKELFERLQPLWSAMASKIHWLGEDPGAGQVVKLFNNMIGLSINLLTVEGVEMAGRFGISEDTFLQVVGDCSGDSWMIQNWGAIDRLLLEHAKGGPDAGHMIALKDIKGAINAAHSVGGEPIVAEAIIAQGEATLGKRYALVKERQESAQP